jgi:hypothetical protein
MKYRTLFKESGIHHSNSGLQISHEIYVSGYFILLFDLTPDRAACVDVIFDRTLLEAITYLLYLEYENNYIDYPRDVTSSI